MNERIKVAVLDDYQHAALQFADWSPLSDKVVLTVFNDHVSGEQAVVERLSPFQVVCVMRERTPLNRNILTSLPNLKLIVSTGQRNASIDMDAAKELGITVMPTGYYGGGAPELTWALLMNAARHVSAESQALKNGGWQQHIGMDLQDKTIGIIGLGKIGSKIAAYAHAFGMNVIAWSENLTAEKAALENAKLVSKEALFSQADFVTVHLVLSSRSKGIIDKKAFDLMKPGAWFINTSRGPLADEEALINALQTKKIAGAALDVFDQEPLPEDHPFRKLSNVLCTPHIGFVTEKTYRIFFTDTVKAVLSWLAEMPSPAKK